MDESNANFIPLGSGSAPISRPGKVAAISRFGTKVIGETKEERKRIAREIRLAAKKIKKKEKADAKRARKLNGILHRRMTKNPEKYHKNKDRNRQRAIDLERQRIQFGAVHQCERLAAKHDPTGKTFNVGEVIVTEDGKVKSKEALQREAEREAQKQAEKEAEALQPRNKRISKNQLKRQEMLKPKPVPPKPVIPEGFSLPEGEENFVELFDITDQEIESRLRRQKSAKKQAAKDLRKIQKEKKKLNRAMKLRKKQCAYAGVTWDPERARREIIGQMTEDAENESNSDSDSDSSDDDSDEEEINGNAPDTPKDSKNGAGPSEPHVEGKKKRKLPEIQRPRLNLELIAKAEEIERQRQEKKLIARRRRREERRVKAEEEAKKAEEARAAEEAQMADVVELDDETVDNKSEKKRKRSKDDDDEVDDANKKERYRKKKKAKTGKLETENGDIPSENAHPTSSADEEPATKKKKKSKTDAVPDASEGEEPVKKKKKRDRKEAETEVTEAKPEKKEKKTKRKLEESNDDKLDRQIAEREAAMKAKTEQDGKDVQNGAEHWNPDALSGDSVRKDKFLRLLGAGKNGTETSSAQPDHKKSKKNKSKDKNSVEEINKVQTELERQYEAGMKMKHDGGSKRRGLGA